MINSNILSSQHESPSDGTGKIAQGKFIRTNGWPKICCSTRADTSVVTIKLGLLGEDELVPRAE